MSADPKQNSSGFDLPSLAELRTIWGHIPDRWLVAGLLAAWIGLFALFGNSTLGYVNTPSMFGWWLWTMGYIDDQQHSWFIPAVVLVLLWCRRDELAALEKKVWWPALALVVVALAVHVLGFMVQQTRVSVLAFFIGIYGFTGLLWGRGWLKVSLFPFFLFVFCVPFGRSGSEIISLPLRLLSTKITAFVCHTLLGIDVIQEGTRLLDAAGSFQYEVAAACSGIRSLTAIVAFAVIYSYVSFQGTWRRLLVVSAAIPLAVVANVFRLTLIVLAAEAFGQKAGDFVHENSWFSLAPYVPAIVGMLFLGWLLREDRRARSEAAPAPVEGVT